MLRTSTPKPLRLQLLFIEASQRAGLTERWWASGTDGTRMSQSLSKCTDLHGLLYRSQQGHFLFIFPTLQGCQSTGSVNEKLSKGRYALTVLFRDT